MYLFVARDMPSEWKALGRIDASTGLPFRLLVEAVCERIMSDGRSRTISPDAMMATLAVRVAQVSPNSEIALDFDNLLIALSPADISLLLPMIGRIALNNRATLRPVVRTTSPTAMRAALYDFAHAHDRGLVIRVEGVTGFAESARVVHEIVHECGLRETDIDLVVDAKDIPRHVPFTQMVGAMPLTQSARSWTVLAGTFPNQITELEPQKVLHRLSRSEWSSYKEYATNLGGSRPPGFGDYGVQGAKYQPSKPFRPSPSFRYTTSDGFIVLRGYRDIPNSSEQYIGHSRLLKQLPEFAEISDGVAEEYVRMIARDGSKKGNPSDWRVMSIHRHTSLMVAQVAAFTRAMRS